MKGSISIRWGIHILLLLIGFGISAAETTGSFRVGVSKIDITPNFPVRLNGYYARTNECTEVAQRIFAKAIAIQTRENRSCVLVSVDNCGVPAHVREKVLQHLARRGITSDRFAICSSHTHSAPKLAGNLDLIFAMDIPAREQAHIERYTSELIEKIEKVALAALKNQKPAKLFFGQTKASFAINRRVRGGPIDDDVPLLQITDLKGKTRALLVNYACHATTLGSDFNKVAGDWPGFAQELLEKQFPGAIALTLTGCGAECNPGPRGVLEMGEQNGKILADAVSHLIAGGLKPLTQSIESRTKQFALPLATLTTRQEFEQRAKMGSTIGYHARKNLERLDRGEKLPTEQPYFIQVWNFGDELAMLFLAGEVVGDYSLRAKKEFDETRLWINAYANDVPCYIPSQRVWKMQGYETVSSMFVYDKPAALSPHIENQIFSVLHELIPTSFRATASQPMPASEKAKRHIYLLLGQSNMVGRGLTESQDRTPNPRVFQFSTSNHWELAVDPLHAIGGLHGVGLGLTFGKLMAAANTNTTIGLVPCAVGSSLLARWERGGDLYSNAVTRARAAMQTGVLRGILWHQGEQDSILESDAKTYHERLAKMIADMRADLNAPELPFVVGQIGEFLYTRKKQQTPFARIVNDALVEIPRDVPRTGCVLSKGLTHAGDEVHFDTKSLRELGKRYATEMQKTGR